MKTYPTVREALTKLKVSPGGKPTTIDIAKGVTLSLFEAERDADHLFDLVLRYLGRQQAVALGKDAVITKGKSAWRRDNLWRLRPETVAKYEPQIETVLAAVREKAALTISR